MSVGNVAMSNLRSGERALHPDRRKAQSLQFVEDTIAKEDAVNAVSTKRAIDRYNGRDPLATRR